MVMRTRRAVPRKWLIVVISAVGGVILVLIGWLSIQVGKLAFASPSIVWSYSTAVLGTSAL
jgi:hypothetical protein